MAMWSATKTLVIVYFFAVGQPVVSSDFTNSGRQFSSARCTADSSLLCGVSESTESINTVSRSQCASACNRLDKCDWFNYVIDGDPEVVNSGRGLCQLFDYDPELGTKTGCALYKVSRNGIFSPLGQSPIGPSLNGNKQKSLNNFG